MDWPQQELYDPFGYLRTEERTIAATTVDDIEVRGFRRHLARQGLDLTDPQPTLEADW